MLNVGVVGYGYWGPNIVRNFSVNSRTNIVSVCDLDEIALKEVRRLYPNVYVTTSFKELAANPDIDAVCIVTPVFTHFKLAKEALLNGKHIFIEKPFTASTTEAEELLEIAEKKKLKIMVDHTFLYAGAVKKIKSVLEDGILGELYYFDSIRVNLGLLQSDINVIWDLACHDFYIMDYLVKERPVAVQASGKAHINKMENISYISVYFQNNMIAHFNVNWLSPVKIRLTLIGGEKKMLLWNDIVPDEKIKIYDKGVDVTTKEGIRNRLVNYRSGDIWTPKVEQTEALTLEVNEFVKYIIDNKPVVNDGSAGLRVVKMLEASSKSIKEKGKIVYL